jgi:hypothetical protein
MDECRMCDSYSEEIRELEAKVERLEAALISARRVCENINEFGYITDQEIHDHAETAIRKALGETV